MFDIVLPKDNESELIRMAERLGWKELCLAYSQLRDISQFQKNTTLKLLSGIIVEPGKETKYKDKVDLLICRTSEAEKARLVAEQGIVDMITGLEGSPRPDFMHHRNSGLNHIICKLLRDKDVAIVFDFSSLLRADKRQRAVLFGRMKQNRYFARKYKINIFCVSFASTIFGMRSRKDFESFILIL